MDRDELARRGNELSARAYALEDRGSLARNLWYTGRTIRVVSRLLKAHPDDTSYVQVFAAHLYRRAGSLPSFLGLRSARRSAEVYERLARLDPRRAEGLHASTRMEYARRAAHTGRLRTAHAAARAAIAASMSREDDSSRRGGDHALLLFAAAEVFHLCGDRAEAEKALGEAVRLFREHRKELMAGGMPYGVLHPVNRLASQADGSSAGMPFGTGGLALVARAARRGKTWSP